MLTEENQAAPDAQWPQENQPAAVPMGEFFSTESVISQPRLNRAAAAILRLEDEQVLVAIQELLDQAASPDKAPPKQLLPPGFAADNEFWMADDFDEPLEDMMPYMF
ncbi:MAG: hypothetical protein EOO56_24815 [Hymenobacter sp.]|nr:MAG: hypothetical protein EOO56_24815 [Hymenobacter sp.]